MPAALLSSPALLSAPSALPSFARLSSPRAPRLPAELRDYLALFGLTVDSLLTYGEANTKIAKGSGSPSLLCCIFSLIGALRELHARLTLEPHTL
jgi:hypothetical protein